MADIDSCSIKGQLFERRQSEDIKKETKHQSVLYLNTKLKTIFKTDKINRKTLGWSVIH